MPQPDPVAGPPPASFPPAQPGPLQPQGWPQQPYGQGPPSPPPGARHGQGPRKPWTGRQKAGVGVGIAAAALIALIIGIAATSSPGGSAAGAPSSSAGSAPSASALAGQPSSNAGEPSSAAASPSAALCTSHSCIVSDIQQALVGQAAKDGSVITKAVCYKSTVKANPGDTYTASCDVTYSDGEVWSEYATLLAATDQITWEPEQELQ